MKAACNILLVREKEISFTFPILPYLLLLHRMRVVQATCTLVEAFLTKFSHGVYPISQRV